MAVGQKTPPSCVVRLDRIVVSGRDRGTSNAPVVDGFRVVGDTFVKPQSAKGTHTRSRYLRSRKGSSQAFVQYQRKMPWLDAARITLVGDDVTGITPQEIQAVIANCANHQVRLVELAVDFDPATGVDGKYVRRFGRFGKSRRREDRGGSEQERFGSRKSTMLVRSYAKRELNVYRIELELHPGLLRKYGIRKSGDLYWLRRRSFRLTLISSASAGASLHATSHGDSDRKRQAFLKRRAAAVVSSRYGMPFSSFRNGAFPIHTGS